ncbi:MAG: hypothetical protein HKN24_00890 [Acidimicrobiales bacterium]|nr:hypothetical protein [Acidimicrobiales bacterium]
MKSEKFIRRAQTFVGDAGTVDQVVVIQKRPLSAIIAGLGAFIGIAVILNLLGVSNMLVVGALGGAALGGVMASLTENYYLAGVGDEVQMLQLASWTGRPERLVKTLPRPIDVTPSRGLLVKSMVIDDEKFIFSKLFEDELASLQDS